MAATRLGKAEALAQPEPALVALPPTIGFVEARQLHQTLLAVRDAPEVILDAGAVETLSTAGVLVLVSFLNARDDLTPPAAVLNPAGGFVDAFSEIGLFDRLMRMEFRT